MIKESATVIAVDGDTVTVEAAIKTTCSSCQVQSDCGSGVISRALSPRTQQLTLRSPVPCRVGDTVNIGVPEAGVVAASLWLYVVPLVVLVVSAIAAGQWLPLVGLESELWTLGTSLLLTCASFVVISGHLKKIDQTRFQPVILSATTSAAQQYSPEN